MTAFGTENKSKREAWIDKTLRSLPEGLRILDAGAGEQAHKPACQHLKYVSQDFAQYDGQGDNRGLQMQAWDYAKLDIVSDITAIPEEDASFDAILCTEVFEHLPEPVQALKEFHRLLKQGGALIMTAPFCSLTHFSPYHYYSGYNRYFYEMHLPRLGFDILELENNGDYFEYLAQELHRLPQVAADYSGINLRGRFFNLVLGYLIKRLAKCSRVQNSSGDILCFGYHVRAIKR
jgi:ubiquinone/menaquinone biosynthesis C-methylase UbiE